ncbi:Putative amidase domain-containing protein [Lachnospiraceae bacterium XBB1006]|nr:Putative amidase domain-containing protein [Lachnospiraceae bacterium XBB1006]
MKRILISLLIGAMALTSAPLVHAQKLADYESRMNVDLRSAKLERDSQQSKVDRLSDYDFACKAVEEYYLCRDTDKEVDMSLYFGEQIMPLLTAKMDIDKHKRTAYNKEYNNYRVTVKPMYEEKWYSNEHETFLILATERAWYETDYPTTIGDVLDIKISKAGNRVITECYNHGGFDWIYGEMDSKYKAMIERKGNGLLQASTDWNKGVKEIMMRIDKYAEEMNNPQVASYSQKGEESTALLRASQNVTRNQVVNWARNNYDEGRPVSSKASVPYYDFSQLTNQYDCTNFVSHALLAGGAKMNDKGRAGLQESDQWYFRSERNRSTSWSGVNQLYSFLTRSRPGNSNVGPYAEEIPCDYRNALYGDVVQFYNGSIWRHSTIVTSRGNNKIYVTGRTSPGVFNNNDEVRDFVGMTRYRLLHILGTY